MKNAKFYFYIRNRLPGENTIFYSKRNELLLNYFNPSFIVLSYDRFLQV